MCDLFALVLHLLNPLWLYLVARVFIYNLALVSSFMATEIRQLFASSETILTSVKSFVGE